LNAAYDLFVHLLKQRCVFAIELFFMVLRKYMKHIFGKNSNIFIILKVQFKKKHKKVVKNVKKCLEVGKTCFIFAANSFILFNGKVQLRI